MNRMSRPMRARGLKQIWKRSAASLLIVAPHAGAWIETDDGWVVVGGRVVAPHAGAWIETTPTEA